MVIKKKHSKELTKEHPIIQEKINKSLELSIKEGNYAAASNSFGASYLSPFALLLGASNGQIGILQAIASLFPSISQLGSCKLIENFSRKKIILTGIIIQNLIWIPMILLALFYFNNANYLVWILICLTGIFYIIMGLVHPAWFSWMGSLVSETERGKYFSRRNRITQFYGLITMIIGALILDTSKKFGFANGDILGYTFFGFGILFTLAFITRIVSIAIISKQYEPHLTIHKKDHISLWTFLKTAQHTAFGRYTLFNSFFRIAVGIASPFFTVYMLKNLDLSYLWFILITISSIIFQIIFWPLLGKASDKFGNVSLTKISAFFIALVPFVWFISAYISDTIVMRIFLLTIAAAVNGFGWAGFDLATNNYVYDSTSQAKQGYALAYMNLLIGFGTFIGSLIGAALTYLNISFMDSILFLFLLSFVARFGILLLGSKYLQEVRKVKRISPRFFIHEFHPLRGTIQDVHNFNHLKTKVTHHI